MRLMHYKRRGVEDYIPVYDNVEEFSKLGVEPFTELHPMKIGDYLLTRNGYYLKLMDIEKVGLMDKYYFPRAVYKQWYKKDGTPSTTKLVYDVNHVSRLFSDGDTVLFVQMVFAGLTPGDAWYIINKNNKHKVKQQLNSYFAFLESEGLSKALKEHIMASMQEDLQKSGIDNTWFGEQLKELITDKKAPVTLRQYAFNKVDTILSNKTYDIKETKINMEMVKDSILNKKQVS